MSALRALFFMVLIVPGPGARAGVKSLVERIEDPRFGRFTGDIGSGEHQGTLVKKEYESLLRWLPDGSKAQCALKVLDQKLGFSDLGSKPIGSKNHGANIRGQELLTSSSCFSTLAAGFYREIAWRERRSYATLADSASEKGMSGWVWDLAQKYSGGNRRLAMELIGLCMNDYLSTPTTFSIDPRPASFLDMSSQSHKWLVCPNQHSIAFLPGSLGQTTELDPRVRRAISSVHRKPMNQIGAKEYHVYASATLGCALTSCGLNENEAALVQDMLARAYRGVKLCDLTKSALSGKNVLPGSISDEQSLQLYNRRLQVVRDAAQVFRDNHATPDSICSFVLYSGPQAPADLGQRIEPGLFTRITKGNHCGHREWSNERCEKALRHIQTWELDELWTRAQHSKGSRFGSRACLAEPPLNGVDSVACEALEKLERNNGQPAPGQGTPRDGDRQQGTR